MKALFFIPFLVFSSCSNSMKREEFDRKNLYQAGFFYEQGFPGKALERAKRIKKSSPRYQEARDWIDRIAMDRLGPAYREE